MNDSINAAMKEAAIAAYPNEACGFVVACGPKSKLVVCENTSPEPQRYFRIAPESYAEACESGEVVAVWHSHTEDSNEPSEMDLDECNMSGIPWFITSVHRVEDQFITSEPSKTLPDGYEVPYLGRPYLFGVFDCWSLAIDFYDREFGIKLPDYERTDFFWKSNIDLIGKNWDNAGFEQVSDGTFEVGDLLLMSGDSGLLDHLVIYIGDEQILHHCHNRLSRREGYSLYWQKRTSMHIRHKSKC